MLKWLFCSNRLFQCVTGGLWKHVSRNNMRASQLSRAESKGRTALFVDIHKGAKLKKAVTNDRSAPILENPRDSGKGNMPSGRGLGTLCSEGIHQFHSSTDRNGIGVNARGCFEGHSQELVIYDIGASPTPALPLSARSTGPALSPRPFGSTGNFRSTPSSPIQPYADQKLTYAGPPIFQKSLAALRQTTTCCSSDGHAHINIGPALDSRPNCGNPPPAGPYLPPSHDRKPPASFPARPLPPYQSPIKPQIVSPRGFKSPLSSSAPRVSTYFISSPTPFKQQLPRSIGQQIRPPPVPRHESCMDPEGPPILAHKDVLFPRWQHSRNGPPLPPPPSHYNSTPAPVPILGQRTGPPAPLPSCEHDSGNHPGGAAPLLPQRQNSLLQSLVKGPAAYSSSSSSCSRPPPPAREPPHLSEPLRPPPPVIRNGLTMNRGAVPAPPPPLRQHSMGPPSPDGMDRTRMAPALLSPVAPGRPRVGHGVPPPLPPRSGPIRPSPTLDDFESRFTFHSISDFPPPEPFQTHPRSYPSSFHRNEFVRSHRDVLPPVPPLR
uniref:WH2 domain-containing protein n=1 Tax=Eptatretus burgeri TaxID=7764 RepID=A0A8C4NK58_EPTBU